MPGGIVFVAHCLLNPCAKVKSVHDYSHVGRNVIRKLMESGWGIYQLPCPETSYDGLARWGQSRSQYDTPYFGRHCRQLVDRIAEDVVEYSRHGVLIAAVVGIEGSPNCAIKVTYDGPWGGEPAEMEAWGGLAPLRATSRPGVFMERLRQTVEEQGVVTRWIGVDEENPDEALRELDELLQKN